MPATRPRVVGDDDHLIQLLTMAVTATNGGRGGDLLGEPERQLDPAVRLQSYLSDPDKSVLCGTFNDVLVGLALVRVRKTSLGRVGAIDELFVEEEGREMGVGEELIDAAVEWCRRQDAVAVDMEALPGDRARKNLCERSGFSARLLVMHRRV